MTVVIAMMILLALALSLAHQKSQSGFRPRGRFATSAAWGRVPALQRPELSARTGRAAGARVASHSGASA
jgi:hypothetical protein